MIKRSNGVDEVLILLFTAYGARVLVLKVPSRAFKSEVIYSGKILIVEETHDKKKETKNIWREKNVRGSSFRVWDWFKVSEKRRHGAHV